MSAKQEFKPIAENLERILQPYLSDTEEARAAQRSNQQLIFVLESNSPLLTRRDYGVTKCMRKVARDLCILAILAFTIYEGDEAESIQEAIEGMENARDRMVGLEKDCVSRAHELIKRIQRLHDSHIDKRPDVAGTLAHTPMRTLFTSMDRPARKNPFIV